MGFETNIPPFMTDDFMKQLKFPGGYLNAHVNDSVKCRAHEFNSTNCNGNLKICDDLQQQYLTKAFDQWNEQIKYNISKLRLKENSAPSDITKETINQIFEHAQQLSDPC